MSSGRSHRRSGHEEDVSDLFDIFRPSFGDGLIPERLFVRLSLNTNDMQRICSDRCVALNPDISIPIKESAIILSTADGCITIPQSNNSAK